MITIVYGTRPELIKLYPIILELKKKKLKHKIIFSGQHTILVNKIIKKLKINNDFNLKILKKNQELNISISKVIVKLNNILIKLKPSAILVQGDTLTAYATSIAAFNLKIKISHVEAGLRTGNIYSPFPEEMYRITISRLAHIHFCPTENNKRNLINEGINKNIHITGNTVVDSVRIIGKSLNKELYKSFFSKKYKINFDKNIILFTCHRRENYGKVYVNICSAIKKISQLKNVIIIYPLHLNPNFFHKAKQYLGSINNVHLVPNQNYSELLFLIKSSKLIITDSGGIQEEAPSFKKKLLIIRNYTERTESLHKDIVELVGTDCKKIYSRCKFFLNNKTKQNYKNPYGNGNSAKKIVKIIKDNYY